MVAGAEAEVLVILTADVERLRVVEDVLVAIGRCVVHDDFVAFFDGLAPDFGVRRGRATEADDR